MGNVLCNENHAEVIANAALSRAYIQQKSSIRQQMNELRIRKSYHDSNLSYREQKIIHGLSKTIQKKLVDLKNSDKKVTHDSLLKLSVVDLSELESALQQAESAIEELEIIDEDLLRMESKNKVLNEKLKNLLKELDEKRKKHQQEREGSGKKIQDEEDISKIEELSIIKPDSRMFHRNFASDSMKSDYLNSTATNESIFNRSPVKNQEKGSISEIFGPKEFKALENVKFYPKISESAVYLKSKILLKKEMQNCVNFMKKDLTINIEKAKNKIKKFEELGVNKAKSEPINENELKDLNFQIFYLQKEIDELLEEKDILESMLNIEKNLEEVKKKH